MISISEEQRLENYNKLIDILYIFGNRTEKLRLMYKEFEPMIKYAPASSDVHFHNAFEGGYVDHILRVFEYTFKVYELWKAQGIDVSNFTIEELGFVALHHDLGKLGFPGEGKSRYIPQKSDWHFNQGKTYSINENIPFTLVQHQSLYLLQSFGIPMSYSEFYGIMIHDGLYDETNKPYYLSKTKNIEFMNQLPNIIHAADLMATKFELQLFHTNTGI